MTFAHPKRPRTPVTLLAVLAVLIALALPAAAFALPQYSTATGEPCATCHTDPSGTGPLTATGQAFAAVPNHQTDPAAAFAQVSQQQATPVATAAAVATQPPAAATPAATASPVATAAALPTAGGPSIALFVLGATAFLALGLGIRRFGRPS